MSERRTVIEDQILEMIMEFYEQVPDNYFDNLDEINKSLTKTHSRKENLGGLISIKEIVLIVKVLPTK